MGMHIWYRLHLPPPATYEDAVEKIRQLREYALTCGFTGAHDWPGVDEIEMGTDADERPAKTYVTEQLGNGRERTTAVPATQWVRFHTMPGDGTESALMGLAAYPATYDTTTALRLYLRRLRASAFSFMVQLGNAQSTQADDICGENAQASV